MPVFVYSGRTASAKTIAGEIEARDKQDAISKLRQRKIVVADVRNKPKDLRVNALKKKVGVKDLKIFARLFGTMVNAGLPIDMCLQIMVDQTQNKTFIARRLRSNIFYTQLIQNADYSIILRPLRLILHLQ